MRRQALLAFDREDFCLAQEIQEENLAARRTIGAPYLICQTLTELAETRLALQDMISAPLLLEESLELAKKAHYEYGRAATWIALGKANLAKGDKEAAMQCFSHAQEIAFNIGTTPLALSSELGKIAAGYYTVGNREDTGARLQELLANPALFPKDRKWAAGLMPFL
jgi:tetratricopeptide (TPR) repeat protein